MKLRVLTDDGESAVATPGTASPAQGPAADAARAAARASADWEQRVHRDVLEFRRNVKDDRLLHSLRDVLPSR